MLSDCILDVGITGDPSYAGSAVAAQHAPSTSRPASAVTPSPSPVPSTTPSPSPSGPAPSPRSGGAVALGETVRGTLTSARQRDRYTFSAKAGQVVYLDGQGACTADLVWRLVAPEGGSSALAEGCDDLGRRVLPVAGRYTIEVFSDGTATGGYGFQLLDVPSVRTSPITVGTTVSDTIGRVGEWHRYTFSGSIGQVVYLDGQENCTPNLLWRLVGPDRVGLGLTEACDDLGRKVLPARGSYAIEVFSDGTATGSYRFTLLEVPPVRTSPIAVGTTVSDTIGRVGEWHRYTFTGSAGQVVDLDGQGPCTPDLLWHLLGPAGGTLGLAEACDDLGRRVLPASGTYTIEVFSGGTATGPYAFRLSAGS